MESIEVMEAIMRVYVWLLRGPLKHSTEAKLDRAIEEALTK
jgi:hypothetical protein